MKSKHAIFIDKQSLESSTLPPELPFRQNEMKALASNFRILFNKGKNQYKSEKQNISNIILILGGPGQGKTSLVKLTINQLVTLGKENSVNIVSSYQNCWKHRTLVSVMGNVFEELQLQGVKKGISLEEQISEFLIPYLAETEAHLVLILDEINSLTSEEVSGLFSLTELFSNERNINFSMIFISRPTEYQLIVSPDLNQRLNDTIILYPYEENQIFDILNYRASLALEPGTFDNELIQLLTEITYRDQNIRLGLEILFRSALYAEKNGLSEINAEIIRIAKGHSFPELRSEILKELKVHELLTLLGIARRLLNKTFTTLNIKDAYRFYKNASQEWYEEPKKISSFRIFLTSLKSLGLINLQVSPTGRGKRGVRARISITDIPVSIIIERVELQLEEIYEE